MKVLVAHPQQQHSYMLARALLAAGHDVTYMTTVYGSPRSLTRVATRFLGGNDRSKAEGRYMVDFPDKRVVQRYEALGLLSLLLLRVDKNKKLYNALNCWIDEHFGHKVAELAKQGDFDAVVCYNEHALSTFKELSHTAPGIARVLDVSASMKPYHAKAFLEDIEANPWLPAKRKREFVDYFHNGLGEAFDEVAASDWFLSPSAHVDKSLCFCGANSDMIIRCPYGSNFEVDKDNSATHSPVRFVYCGRASMPKGIHHLLRAADTLEPGSFELSIIGAYDNADGFLTPYLNKYEFTGNVLKSHVKEIMSKSDVMVFPSLTDGMSLACLEALACGLPLLTTTATGASDFVVEGSNGFVVEPGDEAALAEHMRWFMEHPHELEAMKSAAVESARKITWKAYNECVKEAFGRIGGEQTFERQTL